MTSQTLNAVKVQRKERNNGSFISLNLPSGQSDDFQVYFTLADNKKLKNVNVGNKFLFLDIVWPITHQALTA